MTPFGKKIRDLRRQRGVNQKEMAAALGVSPAYLSILEHGRGSPPNWAMVQKIIGYFNVIWDEADELQHIAALSHPRVTVDTSGLSPQATELANLVAANIDALNEHQLESLLQQMRSFLEEG